MKDTGKGWELAKWVRRETAWRASWRNVVGRERVGRTSGFLDFARVVKESKEKRKKDEYENKME